MSTTGTTLINDTLSRVRDTNATLNATDTPPTTATGRAFVLTMVNHASLFVSLAERILQSTSDLFLSTNTAIYDLTSVGGSDYGGIITGAFVTGVREIDGPVDYKALGRNSRTWLTDTNTNVTTAPLSWAPIGNSLVAFVPVFASTNPTVSLRYCKVPTFIVTEGNTSDMPDFTTPHVARLAALLASLKTRQLTDFQNRAKNLAKDIGVIATMEATGGKAD